MVIFANSSIRKRGLIMKRTFRIADWGFRITDVNMCIGSRDAYSKLVDVKELDRIMNHYLT